MSHFGEVLVPQAILPAELKHLKYHAKFVINRNGLPDTM